MFKNKAILVIASAMLAMPAVVQSQGVTPTAGGKGGTVAADQIVQRYKTFAGSEANAKSLVEGLRTGADVTLTGPAGPDITVCDQTADVCIKTETTQVKCLLNPRTCPTGFTTVTKCVESKSQCVQSHIEPGKPSIVTISTRPAAPMGFGNVDIALALAEARLRPEATPSASDIKEKLLDILGKRASGQGWGEIAKGYGFELKE